MQKLLTKTAKMAILVIVLVPVMLFASSVAWTVLCVVIGIGLAIEFVICYRYNRTVHKMEFAQYIASIVLLALVFLATIYAISIREMQFGIMYLVFITLGIAVNDGIAEIVGVHFGTPGTFFPKTSPNKSWQGAFAGVSTGIVTVVVAILIAANYFGWPSSYVTELCFIFWIVPILAVLGDLLESYVKRSLGVKDFSKILGPEIGGLLDRFDSWLPTLFIVGMLLSLM